MMLNTLLPHTSTFASFRTTQGRSKKPLSLRVEHDGRVWVARFEGRPNFCFGDTEKEATYNLRAGQ